MIQILHHFEEKTLELPEVSAQWASDARLVIQKWKGFGNKKL
jgi:hypothetical protein